MNEADTRAELIDPKLKASGWGVVAGARILREHTITAGRIQVGGGRGRVLIADYVLAYKGVKLAVVEAKREGLEASEGVQQAKLYAEKLKAAIAYASNGREIYQICMNTGKESLVADFLSPDEMWDKAYPPESLLPFTKEWQDKFARIPFEDKSGTWQPRYYQELAIRNTLQAIAQGEARILLTLATGTGKTAIAFQIAWVLFHTRWNLSVIENEGSTYQARRPRILFLADRNILADQAFNAFSAFPEDAMVRIKPSEIRRDGRVPTNGNIFFTIFQSFMADSAGSSTAGSSVGSSTAGLSTAGSSTGSSTEGSSTAVSSTTGSKVTELAEVTQIDNAYGYMYILQCSDGSFYTGSTKNLQRRLIEHREDKGAKHTTLHSPVKLIYYETFSRIDEAFNREKQIQKWSRAKKVALINNDIERLKQLSTSKNNPKVPEFAEGNFGQYPKDYFDFIIIDECHRGGANDEGNWRGILDYFSPAVQLGLTATPKRANNVDTYRYFGEPVYIYPLKEGINDGFLTPFKVRRIETTIDEYIYESDDEVIDGEVDADKTYIEKDFNKKIEIKERENKRVQIFMNTANEDEKTIIFCANQAHAALIRDLVNQNKQASTAPNYCVRVTADDGEIGEQSLREFQDNEKSLPTVLTTSKKLSTGVDARNIRNIVLLRPVKQMIEFKQIIGRGTRLFDGKDFFTVYDFVDAYQQFSDPEWDGEPEYDMGEFTGKGVIQDVDDDGDVDEGRDKTTEKMQKIKIKLADGKEREIIHSITTSFLDADGNPISIELFLHYMFGELPRFFTSEEELRTLWSAPTTRKTLLDKLAEAGFNKEALLTLQKLIDAEKSDLFDVLGYVFNSELKPTSRNTRVIASQEIIYAALDAQQKEFIEFVLKQYIEVGVGELALEKLPRLLEIKYHTIADAKQKLGELENIRLLFSDFQKYLYRQAA